MVNTWITGRESKLVLQKATSWGLAVEAGAEDAVYIISESLGAKAPVFLDDPSLGQTDVEESRLIQESATGSFDCVGRFDGFDMLFYLALGGSLIDDTPDNGDLHFYQSEANIEDLFASIAVLKSGTDSDVWEIPTGTIFAFTIAGVVGQYVTLNWEVVGEKIETESFMTSCTLYLPFNEGTGGTVADRSDESNDGTFTNMEDDEWDTGPTAVSNTAITFDAADEEITVSHDTTLDITTGDFSISMWVKVPAVGAAQQVLIKKETGSRGYMVEATAANNSPVITIYDAGGNVASGSTTAIDDGEWHHIVFTIDRSGNCITYIDGVMDDITAFSARSASLANADDFVIAETHTVNVSVSQIRFWKGRLITGGEVEQLYLHAFVVNDATVIAAATYPTGVAPTSKGQLIMDSNFYIWMNAESGGALDTDDDLYPNSFSITYRRPMEPRFESTTLNSVEPIQSGFAEATIELGFDKLNSDAILDAITDEASQKLLLSFKGPLIADSDYTEMQIYLPSVQWNSIDAPVAGPGPFPVTAVGRILKPASVPTGMDNVKSIAEFDCDEAMNIYLKNNSDVDPSS